LHLKIGGKAGVDYRLLKRYDILCIMVQQEPIYLLSSRQPDLLYFMCGGDLFYKMQKTLYSVGLAGMGRNLHELMNYCMSPNIRQPPYSCYGI
jgi:hypothetical protein